MPDFREAVKARLAKTRDEMPQVSFISDRCFNFLKILDEPLNKSVNHLQKKATFGICRTDIS